MLRQLTIQRILPVVLFALIFALAARIPVDTDVWWHIRSGEYTLTEGMIYADPFSFTFRDQAWINHSWLSQIVLYGVWSAGGVLGLTVFMAGLATLGMIFVYKTCDGDPYTRAFVVVIGAATAAVFWSPRPQMFSFFLSAVVLYLLLQYTRRGLDRLWFIPLIMGVWGNLHAGFSIGFILMAGVIAGQMLTVLFAREESPSPRTVGRLAVVMLASVAALLVNPYGLSMLLVPFQTLGIGALTQFIQEWNSPNFHQRQTWPFIALLAAVLGAAGASRRRLSWAEFILTAGTLFMALQAGRNIAVFAVVAAPVLSFHLHDLLTERGWVVRSFRRVSTAIGVINVVIVIVVLAGAAVKTLLVLDEDAVQAAFADALPVEAVAYLRENETPPNLFNSYNWGGYLIHSLPDTPVFIDGRTDLYGDTFITEAYYAPAVGDERWREVFARYGINTVLIETGSGLDGVLTVQPGWRIAHRDDLAVVFVREAPIPAQVTP